MHNLRGATASGSRTGEVIGRLAPLALGDVVLAEGHELGDWQRRNSTRTLPHCVDKVVASGALANLERVAAGGRGQLPHEGMHFSDSDVYKTLEAAGWDSVRGLSGEVKDFVERATTAMAQAQRVDGYINSWFQGQQPELVWKDLRWGHELYCAGHLLQAATAWQLAGGHAVLASVAERLTDHLVSTFSLEDGDGRLDGVCGHPEVETALVGFYRLSGDERLLALAKRQVELRGRPGVALPSSGALGNSRFPLSYFLHHLPVRERRHATGHAVRELYLQAGVVDVAVETSDAALLAASEAIWEDLFATKTYVTGGHGSRHRDESIGDAYELPNDRAYSETCAAIASFQWNWRLLLATGRSRYAEEMERVFWNTIAGAVSREGTEFFYSNTLHLRTDHHGDDEDSPNRRLPWYACACCPPNLARLMASIQTYLVTRDGSGLQLHMPFSGTIATDVPGGRAELTVRTSHPWKGTTQIDVAQCSSPEPWAIALRAPGRAREPVDVRLNGEPLEPSWQGSYVTIKRRWRAGDRAQVTVPFPIRLLRPHWKLDAARGCVALQRGPLVYCVEGADLEGDVAVEDIAMDTSRPPELVATVPAELQGYVKYVVAASGLRLGPSAAPLYERDGAGQQTASPLPVTFVPYFARGHRPVAAMRVWVPAQQGQGQTQQT